MHVRGEKLLGNIKVHSMHVGEGDLGAYLSGHLGEPQVAAINFHLTGCEACRGRLGEVENFVVRLAGSSRRKPQYGCKERRRRPRFATNDRAVLLCLRPLSPDTLEVLVLDVSEDGMKLSVPKLLDPGSGVEVRLKKKKIAFGEIRYCVQVGDEFHAGMLFEDLF